MIGFLLTVVIASAAASPSPSPCPLPQIAHVYTSDRTDESIANSARTTYVVTHADIVRHGYRTVGEALEDVTGFEISPYGAIGSTAQYGIRGSNSSRVLVLVDGLPAPGSFSNSVEIETLPTTGIDRIEVVEGGGSTLYGTGAIGGVINIISQRDSQSGATLRAGSFGDRELELRTGHLQISHIVAPNTYAVPDGTTRPDSDYNESALHGNFAARLGHFDALLRAEVESDRVGAPGPDQFTSPTSRQRDLNEGLNLTLVQRTARAETTIQLGATDQRVTFGCDPVNDPNCFQPAESLNTESRVDFGVHNLVSGANERVLYGVDLSRGTVRADAGGLFITSAFAQAAAYLQQQLPTRWGSAYAGVRAERDGALGGEISPAAGFVARFSQALELRGNVATAFRAPNASELYFPGFGNPALNPERAKVADLTLTDGHILGGASIGWFGDRTNNLIVTELIDPIHFIFAPENIDHASIEGLTLDLQTRPFHGLTATFNLTDLYRAEDLDTSARLPDDPVLTANLGVAYSGKGLLRAFGATVHTVGGRGIIDAAQPLFDQPVPYTTADAYLSMQAAPQALLTFRVCNLGNERYAAVNGFPMPGRTFELELSTP